jgi:hypothetical protein
MAKPPQDPGSGPRIRARARGGSSSIRPEVVDALGGVERSLSEVAKWEQMLAGRTEGGVPALPEGYVGLSDEVLSPPAEPEAEPEPEVAPEPDADQEPEVREIGLLDAVREAEEAEAEDDAEGDEPQDAAAAADALVAPLLTQFPPQELPTDAGDGSVLWAARTVETSPAEAEQLIAKRRRHARILSWAGALILVAGAALWLVPDRSSDDDGDQELPAVDVTDTTRSRSQILDQTGTTETTTPTTQPATTTPSTTETTRRTTATTRRSTPTTQAPPTTQGNVLQPPGPIGSLPGPGPNRTVPTTTTPPPTTTTTVNTTGGTDGGATGGPTTTG